MLVGNDGIGVVDAATGVLVELGSTEGVGMGIASCAGEVAGSACAVSM